MNMRAVSIVKSTAQTVDRFKIRSPDSNGDGHRESPSTAALIPEP